MKKILVMLLITITVVTLAIGSKTYADESDDFLNSLFTDTEEEVDQEENYKDDSDNSEEDNQLNEDSDSNEVEENNNVDSDEQIIDENQEENDSSEQENLNEEDYHGVSLNDPQVNLSTKSDGNYLDIKWDITNSYRPMVFITKDGKQLYGDIVENANIKLNENGTYNLSFQIKQNGEYIEAFNKMVNNGTVNKASMANIKVGPSQDLFTLIIFLLLSLGYTFYRYRVYIVKK